MVPCPSSPEPGRVASRRRVWGRAKEGIGMVWCFPVGIVAFFGVMVIWTHLRKRREGEFD